MMRAQQREGTMARTIGKFLVTPRVTTLQATTPDGPRLECRGVAVLTWDQGSDTVDKSISFDRAFATADEATRHVYEQVQLRVDSGEL
jgi:hypothetical protein